MKVTYSNNDAYQQHLKNDLERSFQLTTLGSWKNVAQFDTDIRNWCARTGERPFTQYPRHKILRDLEQMTDEFSRKMRKHGSARMRLEMGSYRYYFELLTPGEQVLVWMYERSEQVVYAFDYARTLALLAKE